MKLFSRPLWAPETEEGSAATTETEVKTTPAAEIKVEPEVKTPAPEPTANAEAAKLEVKPQAHKKDWRDDRIAQLTAKLRNSAPAQPAAPVPDPAPLDPTADFNRRVAEAAGAQAERIAAATQFTNDCNAAAESGIAKHGKDEFMASVSQLMQLTDSATPQGLAKYNEFLASALDTGDAPELIFELGKDPAEAMRILDLSPRKMAIELAKKVALKGAPMVAADEAPGLPKPITPVNSIGDRHEKITASDKDRADQLSTGDWMARRNAEAAEYAKAHGLRA